MEAPDRIDSRRMLAELDFPTGLRTEILDAYGAAADELAKFIEGARRRPDAKDGHQVFAIFHMLTRCLTDLIAGAHLLNHRYAAQAYTVMRPVLEGCDLIELFARDAGEATTWVTTEEGHKHFMPAHVRQRLGQERHDPVHSHFTKSGSHPRFAAARLSGVMKVTVDDPSERVAAMWIGPTWEGDAGVLFGWLFACNTLSALAFKARHLEVVATPTAVEWLNIYAALMEHLRVAVEHIGGELGEPSVMELFDEGLGQVRAMVNSLT